MMAYEVERSRMVEGQLIARGITDQRVLDAFRRTQRHEFVARAYHHVAYKDMPLPIPAGQTVSQPYIVAFMLQALAIAPDDRVLEIGSGSGYAAAILSRLAAHVYSVERHPELAELARNNLARAGCRNVLIRQGDGSLGWPEYAPYDRIVVAASGPAIPQPLRAQLSVGGRLVMPVGEHPASQHLVLMERVADEEYSSKQIAAVRFVPLVGQEGW